MTYSETTCWTLIEAAGEGAASAIDEFATRYDRVIRAYLQVRWRRGPLSSHLEDAVQEVFLECLRERGVLQTANPQRGSNFRGFLYGVVRNVARRFELQWQRAAQREPLELERLAADDSSLATVFDRAWARSLLKQATQLHRRRAAQSGLQAVRRVELLRLRFGENLPIREIARQWGEPAQTLHYQYAVARREFRSALYDVVAMHYPDSIQQIRQKCAELFASLGGERGASAP